MRVSSSALVLALCLFASGASAQALRLEPPALLQVAQLPLPKLVEREVTRDSLALRRAEVYVRMGVPTASVGLILLATWLRHGAPWTYDKVGQGYGCGSYRSLGIAAPLLVSGLVATIVGAVQTRRLRQAGVQPAASNRALRITGISLWTLAIVAGGSVSMFYDALCNT